jgi:hypothetical protein
MVLPGKVTAQGWALAPIATTTRPEGSPLTVVLRGKRMPGTEDGPGLIFAGAVIGAALRRVPPACGKWGGRPGGGGAPVRASAREGATWPRPKSDSAPPLPAHGLVVVPVQVGCTGHRLAAA